MRLDDPLFPPIEAPDREGLLDVGGGHVIHWEELGDPQGVPVVVLHGGPGGQIKPSYRRLIDRGRFRAIFFDQRGCGGSTPFGALEGNTTDDLIADIERLREHLGIARWIVMGGSWGSTLALAYGERHPERCLGFVVTGVFLATEADRRWIWGEVRAVYPDAWQAMQDFLPPEERAEPDRALIRRVLDPRPEVHAPASVMFLAYEAQTLDVIPDSDFLAAIKPDAETIASARIFAHYSREGFFLREGQLIGDIGAIAGLPAQIIAGRFDMCTPPRGAFDLHRAWPGSVLTIVAAAGHRWKDPALASAVIRGLAAVADQVSSR